MWLGGLVVVKGRICHRHALVSGRVREYYYYLILVSAISVLLAVTVWSYWAMLTDLLKAWQRNDDYSAGQLVPLIALFLLWRERKTLKRCQLRPFWWGIALIILAQAGRIFGLLFMYSVQQYSFILSVAGLVLMVVGWQVFRSVVWILLFLFLMVPLPGRVHNLISGPLQNMATTGSVFLLEAFGTSVSQQGNVVMLNENTPMAVAEACSGLRMLTAFVIVAAFIAYMIKRPRWQKAVILLSSIPVAVICNILRLCVTAMLFLLVNTEVAEKFFHDFAGLAMMPAAVMLLFGELWLMNKMIVPEPDIQHKSAKTKSAQQTHAKRKKTAQTI
jgi:exosortase